MPEQKMIEQPKMAEPEFKEEKPVDKPKDEPAKDAKNDEPPGPPSPGRFSFPLKPETSMLP